MSMLFEQVIKEICKEAANPTTPLHTSPYKAIDGLLDTRGLTYTLFEEPLSKMKAKHFVGDDGPGHLIVGFRAITDASFCLHLGPGSEYEVQMKAGEFQLASPNESPVIRFYRNKPAHFILSDVKGDVNMVCAFLDSQYHIEHLWAPIVAQQ